MSTHHLPALGTLSYTHNGATFTFSALCQTRMISQPLPNRAGTKTRAVKHTLTVTDIVFSSDGSTPIDEEVDTVRRVLSAQCGELIYTHRGFGTGSDLHVNGSSRIRDIEFGPRPEIIEFSPMGGNAALAAKLVWRVVCVIPECSNAVYQNQPSDFGFEVDWRINSGGATCRTITGFLEIPLTRINNADHADEVSDQYRRRIAKALPELPGFDRTQNFHMTMDRRALMFTFTDTEVAANGMMEGMEPGWTGSQDCFTQMQLPMAFVSWAVTLTANFRVQRDRPKALAWERFGALILSRTTRPIQLEGLGRFADVAKKFLGNVERVPVLPTSLRVQDSLHNQDVSFSFTYTVKSNISKFLSDTRMWTDVPNTAWEKWHKGAIAGAGNERGYMGLKWQSHFDAIVDLCGRKELQDVPPEVKQIPKPPDKGNPGGGGKLPAPPPRFGRIKGADAGPPEESFLNYECGLAFAGAGANARHKPLSYSPTAQAPVHPLDKDARTHFQQGQAPLDTIQNIGPATCSVVLYGRAVRVGFAVVPPHLLSVGGVPAVLDDERFTNIQVGSAAGLPIFGGTWQLTYLLRAVPHGPTGVPKNLFDTVSPVAIEQV